MRQLFQPGRIAARRAILWAGITMAASLLVMMFGALSAFDAAIEPEIDKRSRLIGSTVRNGLERALDLGIPLTSVAGADRYLQGVLDDFSEVDRISLLATDGSLIAVAEREGANGASVASKMTMVGADEPSVISMPILRRNTLVGEIRVETDPTFVRAKLQDVLVDVFVVGLVAVLLAFELVIWVMANALGKPLDRILTLLRAQCQGAFNHVIVAGDSGNLRRIARRISDRAADLADRAGRRAAPSRLPQAYFVDIRLPLFVFSTATEISGAFLPLYARDAGGPGWLSDDLAAIAPLVAYLVAIALVVPFGGTITRHVTPRTLFLTSIPLTAAAMVGVGLGQAALTIAIWHGAMALVYAVATIACQEYAIRMAPEGEDAQAIGSYLFVILGGAFCGTALGGVLADRIGTSPTFFVGAALVIVSGGLGAAAISATVGERAHASPGMDGPGGPALRILRTPRFLALAAGVAAPMNIGMSVFIWFITPLVLEAEGARLADIGRVMMLFYLVPILAGPTVARLADGRVGYPAMLVAGGVIGGLALSSLALWSGFWPMAIVVAVFGLGYSMCDATQYAQAIRIAEESGRPGARETALGALRLIERLAAIAGLIVSALLAEQFGYTAMAIAIGGLLLVGALVVGLAERAGPLHRGATVDRVLR